MALVLLFEDLLPRSVEPFELPGDEFVRAVTSASKTVKEKREYRIVASTNMCY